jgi:tRNA dimethylallyltransferase
MSAPPLRAFVLAIAGPTASGKSRLAMEIARRMPAEIVTADSMQVYRGLSVGTGKPTQAEQAEVPHHLLDVRDPDQPFSAGEYAVLAHAAVADITARRRLPLLVGGTGLYLRAALHGMVPGPGRQQELREELCAREKREPGALHRLLVECDPVAASRIPPGDRVRLVRAIEVATVTGRPLSRQQSEHGFCDDLFRFRLLVLDPPRPLLYRAVEARVDDMIMKGWVEEVRILLAKGYPPTLAAMKAVGYRELAEHLAMGSELAPVVARIKTATRRYAKRQLTWFRAEKRAEWVPLADAGEVAPLADRLVREMFSRGETA